MKNIVSRIPFRALFLLLFIALLLTFPSAETNSKYVWEDTIPIKLEIKKEKNISTASALKEETSAFQVPDSFETEAPAVDSAPAEEDVSVGNGVSAEEDVPAADDALTVENAPTVDDAITGDTMPTVDNAPAVEDTSAEEDAPTKEETSAEEDSPAVEDTTAAAQPTPPAPTDAESAG